MEPEFFGIEGITDEDRAYESSRFSEVCDAIFANPYQKVWGRAGEPPLPIYEVTVRSVLRGVLPFGAPNLFAKPTNPPSDPTPIFPWGPAPRANARCLHPTAIGPPAFGEFPEENPYSGYFRKGSRALAIGRYSTCCTETRRGHPRSLALVGKLYPTTDPNHAELLRTANFITQQDLGGDYSNYINDAEVRNAPDTRAWRRGGALPVLLVTGAVFQGVDKRPSQRQLYQLAEIGKPKGEGTRAPEFLRFLVATEQPRIEGEALDFRDEIMAQIFDKGDPKPKRTLTFNIEVTDEGTT